MLRSQSSSRPFDRSLRRRDQEVSELQNQQNPQIPEFVYKLLQRKLSEGSSKYFLAVAIAQQTFLDLFTDFATITTSINASFNMSVDFNYEISNRTRN